MRIETSEQESLEARLRDRRFWAAMFDVWLLPVLYRSADGRGWHEQLSSTRIAAAGSWTDREVHLDAPRRRRTIHSDQP